jgi:hypothetical protein
MVPVPRGKYFRKFKTVFKIGTFLILADDHGDLYQGAGGRSGG